MPTNAELEAKIKELQEQLGSQTVPPDYELVQVPNMRPLQGPDLAPVADAPELVELAPVADAPVPIELAPVHDGRLRTILRPVT